MSQKLPDNASWLEVNANALKNNIQAFRSISQNRFKLGVVLKGNAYGHGTEEIFSVVQPSVDCIYLISAEDALRLREWEEKQGLSPRRIIVIGALTLEEVLACVSKNIELVLGDDKWKGFIQALRNQGLKADVHVHLDTGLCREGFSYDQLETEAGFLKQAQDVLNFKGVMSHFANTEDVTEQGYALQQVAAFQDGTQRLKAFLSISQNLEAHFAASAAALVLPVSHFDMVRVGISLYGLWPSVETRISAKLVLKDLPQLQPVLSWKCKSQALRSLKKGSYVGYGCTYRCSRDTRIAVLPVGYYDGYPRLATGKAHVLVNQKRCPILGRVMMNHLIVDVTDAVRPEEEVVTAVLLGKDGEESVSAETLAGWAQTIHYELVTRIGSHLKRIVIHPGGTPG